MELVFVADDVSISLNNSAGMVVKLRHELNVPLNILLVSVADDVSMALNNSVGTVVSLLQL